MRTLRPHTRPQKTTHLCTRRSKNSAATIYAFLHVTQPSQKYSQFPHTQLNGGHGVHARVSKNKRQARARNHPRKPRKLIPRKTSKTSKTHSSKNLEKLEKPRKPRKLIPRKTSKTSKTQFIPRKTSNLENLENLENSSSEKPRTSKNLEPRKTSKHIHSSKNLERNVTQSITINPARNHVIDVTQSITMRPRRPVGLDAPDGHAQWPPTMARAARTTTSCSRGAHRTECRKELRDVLPAARQGAPRAGR